MKHLLLTQRILEASAYSETREALDIRWGAFVRACGFLPTPLSGLVDPDEYFNSNPFAGLVITGGNDLSTISHSSTNSLRDKIDGRALEAALNHNLPVLGVCRGMQFLVSHFGGVVEPIGNHVGSLHEIFSSAEGAIAGAIESRSPVNSFHTCGVTSVPGGFKVLARAEDESIEAIENTDRRIIGIMWHPEREEPFRESDVSLFRMIFAEHK